VSNGLVWLDAAEFARERLGFEPDEQQARVLDPLVRRGILCCCRQWGKSTVTAIKAVHHAATRRDANVLIVSPSQRQSGEFLRKAREFVQRLGHEPRGDGLNRVSLQLPNGSRIVALPGERSFVRGFSRVSLLLVDEAAEVSDNHYRTVRPFLAMAEAGALWLMSTPRGKRGFFWRAWDQGGPQWLRVRATAEENPRFSREFLAEERQELGERWYRQEYGCEFLDTHDGLFRDEDIDAAVDEEVPALW
jgi:hypothetical protein